MKLSLFRQSTGNVYTPMAAHAHLACCGFFKQIYLNNRYGVPTDKPVLLAANHPTAFIDPYLLCTYLDPPIYNMTRGDVFKKPVFRKLMESINMFPVFRVRDGYASRDRNDEVFEYCVDKLQHKRVVTIYVEGEHHLEKHVRPVQKGIARIAFAAYERHRLEDLQIIPAGCNYQYGDRARDEVMINIGAPIYVRDYWESYQTNPAQTILRLCNDIELALKTVCLHVDAEADYRLAEQLLTIYRSNNPVSQIPVLRNNFPRFEGEKAVCDRLNALPEAEKSDLRTKSESYFSALQQSGLDDGALVHPGTGRWAWVLLFLAGLLPFAIGYVSCWPVKWAAYWVADKKVKKKEFYGSVVLGVGHLSGILYYLLIFLIALISGRPIWIGGALMLPLLGWFSIFYQESWSSWRAREKARQHPERGTLLRLRADLADETAG